MRPSRWRPWATPSNAWPTSRTGAAALVLSAVLALATGVALQAGQLTAAFVLSTLAVAIRAGVWPLTAGTASLCANGRRWCRRSSWPR